MRTSSRVNLHRGIMIVTVFLFWILAICTPAGHFQPGKWDRIQHVLKKEPPSSDFLFITLAAIGAMIIAIVLICTKLRVRKTRKKDDIPHELYREPVPTPWTVYPAIGLLLLSVAAIVWWAGHLETPAKPPVAAEQTRVPAPGQAENTPPLPPAVPERGPIVGPMMKYLASLLALSGLTWIVLRQMRGRTSERLGEQTGTGLPSVQALPAPVKSRDLSDVVLRCYRDMCSVLSRRLSFPQEMTAREFASRCSQSGVSEREVSRLTELFEKVRYGRHVATLEEQNESIALLQAVGRRHGRGIG